MRMATMEVVRTRAELAAARSAMAGPVAVVMTMGALHEGHAALLRAARSVSTVIATIFVNPLQFGPHEDFARYPRTLDADLALCAGAGVGVVFTPAQDGIYPHGEPVVRVDPGSLGDLLEGASRPGHFAGVLTVVLKLLHLTKPDLAYFGEKDYQQLLLIRAMVRDLDLPVRVVGVPIVREPDGLALSSRNRYLSPAERERALSLPAALRAGMVAAADGAEPAAVLDAAHEAVRGVELDYLVLTDPELRPLGTMPADGIARMLIAARVGTTRLIDNHEILWAAG